MAKKQFLNNDWKFAETFDEAMLTADYDASSMQDVRVPHNVKDIPFHYCDENAYQMLCGYRRKFDVPRDWEGKKVMLTFDAVGHVSEVYVNGEKVGGHGCGYTAFTLDISDAVKYGESNLLVLKVDTRESVNVPPFGFVIDYMTYGGIYRDVYLTVHENAYIEDVFVQTQVAETYMQKDEERSLPNETVFIQHCRRSGLVSEVTVVNPKADMRIRQYFSAKDGTEEITLKEYALSELTPKQDEVPFVAKQKDKNSETYIIKQSTGDIELWDIDHPKLYEIRTELVLADGKTDEKNNTFGYRKFRFKENGFYLNGRRVKIRGLNRHQSYAYVGYAMPASMQEYDAKILKEELGLNAVRTSHYPQSHDFIAKCDELGLLVFTELPGWQHIGDVFWKQQAVENVKDMVIEYRNHPSIILWGVRINESVDDDEFYTRTNAVAHALDPTRQTGGVRCYKKGSFLEDVYTYNDFVHSGKNQGCDKKSDVTSDMKRPYLVSEYNGHMYPTKTFDWEEHRLEHALRHARVLDAVAKQENIAGSFGWCMFDYNTHKDFGSGDRICYHGVMDMFRNPKLAALVYESQADETPVLELSSSMDIGEHPGSNRGEVYIITNADSVRMYKNGEFVKEYKRGDSGFTFLPHGPILVDDYIGDALEKKEHMSHGQAEAVKSLLNATARFGLYNMPKRLYLRAGRIMVQYRMKMSDAVELFNRYIGNWGGEATTYRFEAIKNGNVVKTITKGAMHSRDLEIKVSHTTLRETHTYDVAAVRIRAVDEWNNTLNFANDPVAIRAEGEIELIGPELVSLQGGMFGCYVKTKGTTGTGTLTFSTPEGLEKKVEFTIE